MTAPDDAIVQLLLHVGALKRLPRQGWVHLGVPNPESVADHSFRLALMTLLLAQDDPAIDTARALVLALCHDLPEAIAGDVTPFDESLADAEVDRDRLFRSAPAYSEQADRIKRAAEEDALHEMTGELPEPLCRLIVDAWEEYEAGNTVEARLVRQLDKLEALLQGIEYRRTIPDLAIESFELGALERVQDDRLRRLMAAIVSALPPSDNVPKG
jgi:putative hydrolase of HD superfamily